MLAAVVVKSRFLRPPNGKTPAAERAGIVKPNAKIPAKNGIGRSMARRLTAEMIKGTGSSLTGCCRTAEVAEEHDADVINVTKNDKQSHQFPGHLVAFISN
jgi:hypothetical protein